MTYEHVLAVDVERIVSQFLRANTAVTELVDDRVYSELPKAAEWPAVRLNRVGGGPATQPARLDLARIQIDVWGGTKANARTIAATVLAVLGDELPGVYDGGVSVVTAVRLGTLRYSPDETFTPAKPRYIGEVSVYSHPN
jgi:hypothetical protein